MLFSASAAPAAWSASLQQSLPPFTQLRDNITSRPAKSARSPETLRCASNIRGAQSSIPPSNPYAIRGPIRWNKFWWRDETDPYCVGALVELAFDDRGWRIFVGCSH